MKLYYKPGACSLATHITLNELNAVFVLESVDTEKGLSENGADFSTISPNGYVPALETDDGDVITENLAVLQYLADLSPQLGLAPKAGTMERIRLQELLSFLSSELHKAFGPFFKKQSPEGNAKKAALTHLSRRLDHIEARLADGRPFLLGDTFTVADAYAFVILNWSNFIEFDLKPWNKAHEYVERVRTRQSVHNAMLAEGLISNGATA